MSENSSRAKFGPKSASALDWAIMASGLLAFIFSFLPYYTVSLSYHGTSASSHGSAWHGFFGWAAVFLAAVGSILVAAQVFAPETRLPVAGYLWAFVLYVLALIFVIFAAFIWPGDSTLGKALGLSYGRGIGYWLSLIVILGGAVVSFLRLQQTGPLPGPLSKIPRLLK
jgi:hypothetical protein